MSSAGLASLGFSSPAVQVELDARVQLRMVHPIAELWIVGRVGRDLVKDGIWSSSSTALLISLLERPSSRTRSGLSGRPLMPADGRGGHGLMAGTYRNGRCS